MALATIRRARDIPVAEEADAAVDEELYELEQICGGLDALPALRIVPIESLRVRDEYTAVHEAEEEPDVAEGLDSS
jgi:hypothetical protein